MTKFVPHIFSAVLGLLVLPAASHAADPVPVDEPVPVVERMAPAWTFSINPINGWLPGFKGDTRVFGVDASVDISAWDLIENLDELLHALDGFYEGSGEFRFDRFGFQYDVVYLDLTGSRQFGGDVISGSLDAAFQYTLWTLAGNYRFYETPTAYADVIAGARYTDVSVDLDLTFASRGFEASDGDSWWDPIVGVKGRYNLTPNWYLKGSAIYGGFGVGSDWVYDLTGLVGYEWNNGIELAAGWRITDTDYQNGSFKWDMQLSGPILALTFKF